MTAPLELTSISKSYQDGDRLIHALRAVSLRVETGELVAVMGPSGSGKSTLLSIAGGLEQPTAGEVTIDGQTISALSSDQRAGVRRRAVGYVFQEGTEPPARLDRSRECSLATR